jgi:hypothetical protein
MLVLKAITLNRTFRVCQTRFYQSQDIFCQKVAKRDDFGSLRNVDSEKRVRVCRSSCRLSGELPSQSPNRDCGSTSSVDLIKESTSAAAGRKPFFG